MTAGASADPGWTYVFPLNTVLFPGGMLPLKIFEQRYLEMTKVCIADNREFGVCLIKEGRETGTPAVPQEVGCLARIAQWDMPQLGVFQLNVEGTQRFRIARSRVEKNGLVCAIVERMPADAEVPPREGLCGEVLKAIIEKVGPAHFPAPHRFDDAAWIGYRLSEVLPLSLDTKQQLLGMSDPQARLTQLSRILTEKGLRT